MYGMVNHCPRWSLCSMIIRTYQSPAATRSNGTSGVACSRPDLLERADEHVGVLEALDVDVVAQPAHADRAAVGHVDHEGAHAVGSVEGAHEAVCGDVAAEDDGAEVGGRGVGHARSSEVVGGRAGHPAQGSSKVPTGDAAGPASGPAGPDRGRSCPTGWGNFDHWSIVDPASDLVVAQHRAVGVEQVVQPRRPEQLGPAQLGRRQPAQATRRALDARCPGPRPGATAPPHRGALERRLGARQVPPTTRAVPTGVPRRPAPWPRPP